ncbi:MAG: DUF3108 domain-containing protein [Candidatus Marinimicrobia bacterium]|nr:DUF3108 domain-containing protein [Candidatus Neomarinimicrobiota bacterium]MDD5582980.1 DUF3108 domain-containing protein [Candidatus Neomarinimicrobiota bacterium]
MILIFIYSPLNAHEYFFDIFFRGIPGGNAKLTVDYQVDTVFASFIINSSGFVDTFFKVRDTTIVVASYPDFFTLFFDKRINEGKYKARREFNVKNIQHKELPYPVRDEYTTMIMLLDPLYFSVDSVLVSLWDRKDSVTVPLFLSKAGKEIINSPAGTFPTFVYKPSNDLKNLIKDSSNSKIWISETLPPLPVQMQIHLKYGSILCVLKKVIR